MSIYSLITRGKDDRVLYKQGVLNSDGRLSDSGMRDFLDLLFIGKTPQEAHDVMLKAAQELNDQE